MESKIASPPLAAGPGSGSGGSSGDVPPVTARVRRPGWLLVVLAACLSLIVGATVQHAFDQRNAARDRYRMQVNTTIWRFQAEERRQIAMPVAQRSTLAFSDLADSIGNDAGVNGSDTLTVSLGSGSVGAPAQIAFSATVASPYASTTFAVWEISVVSNGALGVNEGACVLWSSLQGPGRATSGLNLGGGEFLQACSPRWWSPGPVDGTQPRLGLAGIPQSPG